jgi:cell wall-associated NlpC family hydrolase
MALSRPRRTTRALLALVTAALAAVLLPSVAAYASPHPVGHLESARQAANGNISIVGWAYDPARLGTFTWVDVYVDGHFAGRPGANRPRPDVNRAHRVPGNHGVAWTFAWTRNARLIQVYARPSLAGEVRALIGSAYLNPLAAATSGARIVAGARKFLGTTHPGYREGGTSPVTGFDCSGYTQYAYRLAKVANLPRTAEQQRHAVRLIARAQARPGDLVFYLSGGRAYHVAIYAGASMQYSAATPHDGIRYQGVWSSAVQYGTTWH